MTKRDQIEIGLMNGDQVRWIDGLRIKDVCIFLSLNLYYQTCALN